MRCVPRFLLPVGILLVLPASALAQSAKAEESAPPITPAQSAFFETRIRPLLFTNCFSCHGPTLQSGSLRLDSRKALLRGGASGPAVTVGEPGKSALIRAIHYDGKIKMPPTGKLKPAEIAALTEWVAMGAPWPETKAGPTTAPPSTYVITPAQQKFWSFVPVRKPALPKVRNTAWVKSPIDRFILAKIEARGLTPAPPADKRTLLRRVYFDLIGLPPTPAEVAAFLADRAPNAFAKVVDRLLASPHYGERWGRRWLDVARYADSNGLDENLAFGAAYLYRDYVVAAFNKDKPYDQFVREQIAGDLLPASDAATRNERLTATGFLSLGPKVLAEPDKPKLVMDIVDEQIEVTSKAFLGLTVACARCHNHKFDPIPTKDYYALAGIFKSTRTMENINGVARIYERPLMTPALEAQLKEFEARLKTAQEARKTITDRADAALKTDLAQHAENYLHAGWELARQPALRSVADRPAHPGDPPRIQIEAESFARGNVIRDFETFGKGIGVILNQHTPDFAEWDITVPDAGAYQIELRYASAEERPVRLSLNGKVIRENAAGQNTGSFQPEGQRWEAQGLFDFQAGKNTLRIDCESFIPHFDKLLIVPAAALRESPSAPSPRSVEAISAEHGHLNPAIVRRFAERLRTIPDPDAARKLLTGEKDGLLALPEHPESLYPEPERQEARTAIAAVTAVEKTKPVVPVTLAVDEGQPENVKIHIRGNTQMLGDEAPRGVLTVLGGDRLPPIDPKHSGRLELAQWLTRPDNPLISRVAVNRIWLGHFGEGIVRTPDNWGLLGDRPDHPELLDWLAATFVEGGWSFKKLHRRILLSNTYQMSCATDPKGMQADPDNRLVWHMNRRRLEAEPFRDAILAVAGKLDTTIGGSLLTTRDNDYVTNDQSANAAQYGSPRRSLYLPVIRNALFDMFQAFDFGDPSTTHAQRASTTVAPQALYMMNSPFVLEQSRAFAENLLVSATTGDAERLRQSYLRAYGRPPSAAETGRVLAYLNAYAARLTPFEPEAMKRRLRAWQSFCQILFASNEFIYLN